MLIAVRAVQQLTSRGVLYVPGQTFMVSSQTAVQLLSGGTVRLVNVEDLGVVIDAERVRPGRVTPGYEALVRPRAWMTR